jgi:hypothetical protein
MGLFWALLPKYAGAIGADRDRDLLPLKFRGIYRKGLAACFCVIGFRHD